MTTLRSNCPYHSLYRLSTAVTNGSTNYPKWGLSWNYDRYGNRNAQSVISGCVAPMTCPTNSVAIDGTTNRTPEVRTITTSTAT